MIDLASKMTKIAVPKSLEMAIIKIRASKELDWESACEHLAGLANPNGKKFQKAVNREANRRYKSRHLVELNKSKKTFIDQGYNDGFDKGHLLGRREGAEEATNKWRVSYPCSVCGEPIYITPELTEWNKMIGEHLAPRGWKHGSCHKK